MDGIADVLKSERLGHEEAGMRGVYGHVSPAMRAELTRRLAGAMGKTRYVRAPGSRGDRQ